MTFGHRALYYGGLEENAIYAWEAFKDMEEQERWHIPPCMYNVVLRMYVCTTMVVAEGSLPLPTNEIQEEDTLVADEADLLRENRKAFFFFSVFPRAEKESFT